LECAAQLARALARAGGRGTGKLNRQAALMRVERLVNIIETAQDIERGLDTARTGLRTARDAYELMREQALAELYEMQDRL
jgi:hypothetical protein